MSDIKQQIDFALEEIIIAKQRALAPLELLCESLSDPMSNFETAKAFVKEVCRNEDTIGRQDTKNLVTPVAIAHKIYCEVGDYGNGEFIVLDQYGVSNYGVAIGDWVSSSESC